MSTERDAAGRRAVQEASVGLPLAAALLFAVFLSLSAFTVSGDDLPPPPAGAEIATAE